MSFLSTPHTMRSRREVSRCTATQTMRQPRRPDGRGAHPYLQFARATTLARRTPVSPSSPLTRPRLPLRSLALPEHGGVPAVRHPDGRHNPVTAYRQLVQQYAKNLAGETVSPAEAAAEANAVFLKSPISASLSGLWLRRSACCSSAFQRSASCSGTCTSRATRASRGSPRRPRRRSSRRPSSTRCG